MTFNIVVHAVQPILHYEFFFCKFFDKITIQAAFALKKCQIDVIVSIINKQNNITLKAG